MLLWGLLSPKSAELKFKFKVDQAGEFSHTWVRVSVLVF